MDIAPDRATAQLLGTRFYAGPSCKRGHEGTRFTSTAACRQCAKDAGVGVKRSGKRTPEQGARYRAANPDKIKAERARRHEREKLMRAPTIAARKEVRAAERVRKALAKASRTRPPLSDDERAARRTAYNRAKSKARRALKRGAAGGIVSPTQLAALLALQGGGCAYCGERSNLHLDHIKPVSQGGRHEVTNLQWLCAAHNMAKRTADDREYRASEGIARLTPWDVHAGLFRVASALPISATAPAPTLVSSARMDALRTGRSTYVGKPCPHGHGGERYVTSSGCVACLAARKKAR